ncbi:MAG: filamentous hemagglutinin N-terminal domain-containing protein [Cyanobacteria bacterium P01_G01_bin.38]
MATTSFAQMEIRPDTTLGSESSIPDGQGNINFIEGGATRGINLFHSFEEFNIRAGEGAFFIVPDGAIENVFSRITGNDPSNIDGVLGSLTSQVNGTLSDADLYLMNPNGVIFGPGATLNLGGSLVVTTADGVSFGEQGSFDAFNPDAPSQLLSINPSALLFSQSQTPAIQSFAQSLTLSPGQGITLVGGDVSFQNSIINGSFGGEIEVGGLAGAGRVGLEQVSGIPRLAFETESPRGNISLDEGSSLFLTGDGRVSLYAQKLDIDNSSRIFSFLLLVPGLGEIQGGDVVIDAEGEISVDNDSFIISALLGSDPSSDLTNSGNIEIEGRSLSVSNGSSITSGSAGQGNAGNVDIEVADSIVVSGRDLNGNPSVIGSPTGVTGVPVSGSGGSVNLGADTIFLSDGAGISARNQSDTGDAGSINIVASDSLLMNDGAFLTTETVGPGNAGQINIQAQNIQLSNSSLGTQTFGPGNAGQIDIQAQNIQLRDDALVESATFGQGRGGNIDIMADQLIAQNGGQISASSGRENVPGNFGRSGDIQIEITDLLELDGETARFRSGIFAETASFSRAGDLTINTGRLIVRNGAAVSASAAGSGSLGGDSGILTINADESIDVVGNGFRSSALVTEASGVGDAGDLFITTNRLAIRDGGVITSATLGQGDAADVQINAADMSISGVGTTGSPSEISSRAELGAIGRGGDVRIQTNNLSLEDSGQISAASSTQDVAGNIFIDATDKITLRNAEISTAAISSSGGDILINASPGFESGVLALETNGDITTESLGDGGNITLLLPVVALEDSDIIARSQGGNGGNITLATLFSDTNPPDNQEPFDGDGKIDINADGQLSSGNIVISDTSFVQSNLVELSDSLINVESLVASSCIARSDEQGGALVISSSDSLPEQPLTTTTNYTTGTVNTIDIPATETPAWQLGEAVVEPQAVYQLPDGRLIMSQQCE